MKILALIPARAGSKRLPRKNIRLLGDKPLILWSVEILRNLPEICDILVSTDSPEIAATVSESSALVPWLRPAELSSDTATSVDVAIHALDWYEAARGKVDGLMLLQPTSPFRTRGSLIRGIDLFQQTRRAVVGVSATKSHPYWCFQLQNNLLVPFIENGPAIARTQDLPPAFAVNGSFYLISPEILRAERTFIPTSTTALLSELREESIDIDTEWDWRIAECFLSANDFYLAK